MRTNMTTTAMLNDIFRVGIMKLDCLDGIHVTFLFYLRVLFQKIGFFVGSNPWKVIVTVHLVTIFCVYGAISVMWPFAYHPELNENVMEELDESFAQQDGTPLLTKKWARAQFGEEKFASMELDDTVGASRQRHMRQE